MQDILVENLGLSVRSTNCLRRAEICYLSQFLTISDFELNEI